MRKLEIVVEANVNQRTATRIISQNPEEISGTYILFKFGDTSISETVSWPPPGGL